MDKLSLSKAASLKDVPEHQWNRLMSPETFYMSRDWLLTQEAVPVTYLLVYSGGTLVGAMPFYRFKKSRKKLYHELFGRDCDLLFAGARTGYTTHLLRSSSLSEPEAREMCLLLVNGARELAAEYGYGGVIFDYLTNESLRLMCHIAKPAIAYRLADTEIYTRGASLPEYLDSLPGKARRVFQREIKRFQSAGWRTGEERMSGIVRRASELLASTQEKYGSDLGADAILEFMTAMADNVDDHSVVFTCRDDQDELRGYVLAFSWMDRLYARVSGFDYPWLRDSFEYFNLVFYAPVEYMHRHSLVRYYLGPAYGPASEAKIRRGATLAPRWACAFFGEVQDGTEISWHGTQECATFRQEMSQIAPWAIRPDDWNIFDGVAN